MERMVVDGSAARADARAASRADVGSIVDRLAGGAGSVAGTVEAVKLKLDLHEVFNRGQDIDRALRGIIDEAVAKKATLVEIIPGKGSGQLKKRVLRFLDQKEVKALYHRVEKDSQNWGRLFVHFRWK
jgi:DNA-nicking Smr family endonuclease